MKCNAACVYALRHGLALLSATSPVNHTRCCIAVTEQDRAYMRQALKLARRGEGHTFPNPAVGCVIVKDGQACAFSSSILRR